MSEQVPSATIGSGSNSGDDDVPINKLFQTAPKVIEFVRVHRYLYRRVGEGRRVMGTCQLFMMDAADPRLQPLLKHGINNIQLPYPYCNASKKVLQDPDFGIWSNEKETMLHSDDWSPLQLDVYRQVARLAMELSPSASLPRQYHKVVSTDYVRDDARYGYGYVPHGYGYHEWKFLEGEESKKQESTREIAIVAWGGFAYEYEYYEGTAEQGEDFGGIDSCALLPLVKDGQEQVLREIGTEVDRARAEFTGTLNIRNTYFSDQDYKQFAAEELDRQIRRVHDTSIAGNPENIEFVRVHRYFYRRVGEGRQVKGRCQLFMMDAADPRLQPLLKHGINNIQLPYPYCNASQKALRKPNFGVWSNDKETMLHSDDWSPLQLGVYRQVARLAMELSPSASLPSHYHEITSTDYIDPQRQDGTREIAIVAWGGDAYFEYEYYEGRAEQGEDFGGIDSCALLPLVKDGQEQVLREIGTEVDRARMSHRVSATTAEVPALFAVFHLYGMVTEGIETTAATKRQRDDTDDIPSRETGMPLPWDVMGGVIAMLLRSFADTQSHVRSEYIPQPDSE